ncbi:GDCCVxC domain-containing (seleno)protein [Ruegeria profundi]|uniref:GDCCVxC domain-containing (seleno)protein n=1 Tax=Ruegeria profundi TaxID=1685378 RepID=UPI003C7D8E1B
MTKQTVVLDSTLTCPECGRIETERMPTDTCQWFYECKSCRAVLKPLSDVSANGTV